MSDAAARRERVARVVAGALRQALRDAGRARLALLRADSPEGALLRTLLKGYEDLPLEPSTGDVAADALALDPINRTALLLTPDTAAAPVLPLGDLYASRVAELGDGRWSAPEPVRALAERAGGVERLDAWLAARLERREKPAEAARLLDGAADDPLESALRAGWWWRRRVGMVPKLEPRTVGVDLGA